MRGPLFCQYGMIGGGTGAVTAGTTDGLGLAPEATGTGPIGALVGADDGGAGDSDRATGFVRGFRRFGIFCLSSHTLSVSSDTSTPNLASDSAISRIDAPAPRSANSTLRYGSSSANRRERGRRPSAIKRASTSALLVPTLGASLPPGGGAPAKSRARVGMFNCSFGVNTGGRTVGPAGWTGCRAVVAELWPGRGVGATAGWLVWGVGSGVGLPCCMRSTYPASACDATGAPRATSKRKRLDVGVLTYSFILVFVIGLGSFFDSWSDWFIGLVDSWFLGFGSLVGYYFFGLGVSWVSGFIGRLDLGLLWLMIGGGGC